MERSARNAGNHFGMEAGTMNTTGKTITAITTAAAIGTGVLLTTMQEPAQIEQEQPPAQVEFVDDIVPIRVPLYSVPSVEIESIIAETPDIETNSIETPEVALYTGGVIDVDTIGSVPADVSTHTVSMASAAVIGVEGLGTDIPALQALQTVLSASMRDQRMLEYDQSLSAGNKALAEWMEIYSSPPPPPIEHIPLPRGIRMIAELRSSEHAAANLAFYRQQGYNACLITIDGTESASNALQLVALVRAAGMSPWIAWAGPEKLEWSIYREPATLSRLLRAAARASDGYLVAWRRTSAHLVAQDAPYIEHLVQQVRSANPAIYVVGESYYGQTWENLPHVNRKGWEARDNVPRNQSGILIAGIATQGYAVETMLRSTFARWVAAPRLAMVLGDRAYYASSNSTGRSFLSNLRIKQQLERRFLRAGCAGTVTIHGDGSDRGSTLMTVDDLGKYRIQ